MSDGAIHIRESTFGDPSGEMRIDKEAHVIRHVKCLGRVSKNEGRIYTDQALADGAKLYEGISVNVDHRDPEANSGCRAMADGFGVLRGASIESDGVYADLHYLESHPLAGMILERAERFPGNFGMSHDATGKVHEDDAGKPIVEGLHAVESVDLVSRPATNAGLFESEQRSDSMFSKGKRKHTVRSVLEANPKDEGAAALLLLLEEEAFAADAALPVETEEPNAKDAIKAALRKLVLQAFDDDKLDAAATVARIKKIIQTQEKLTKQLADDETTAPPPPDAAMEAVKDLRADIVHRDGMRDLLEDRGLRRSDLTDPQRKSLDRAENVEAVEELIESWEVRPTATSHTRLAIGPAAGTHGDSRTTDELLESVFGKAAPK